MVSSIDTVGSTTLAAEELGKSFAGTEVFADVSLEVAGGLFAVAGSNGSGKTTLLKILAGLLPATTGRVRLERDGTALSGQARRLAVGWAGPDLALYGELTGEENLRFFRRAAGLDAEDADIRRRLSETGLSTAAGQRRVEAYSTGMRQRLRLAFARLFDPPLLVLDEPFTGLDAEGRELVHRLVADARRTGTVVLASNDERDFVEPDGRLELQGARRTS